MVSDPFKIQIQITNCDRKAVKHWTTTPEIDREHQLSHIS